MGKDVIITEKNVDILREIKNNATTISRDWRATSR